MSSAYAPSNQPWATFDAKWTISVADDPAALADFMTWVRHECAELLLFAIRTAGIEQVEGLGSTSFPIPWAVASALAEAQKTFGRDSDSDLNAVVEYVTLDDIRSALRLLNDPYLAGHLTDTLAAYLSIGDVRTGSTFVEIFATQMTAIGMAFAVAPVLGPVAAFSMIIAIVGLSIAVRAALPPQPSLVRQEGPAAQWPGLGTRGAAVRLDARPPLFRVAPTGPSPGAPGFDFVRALERLAYLRAAGHLTAAEFRTAKHKVLNTQ